jgi:siroheme synthase (precorrin-2 oxidase/ferrochelatase)
MRMIYEYFREAGNIKIYIPDLKKKLKGLVQKGFSLIKKYFLLTFDLENHTTYSDTVIYCICERSFNRSLHKLLISSLR